MKFVTPEEMREEEEKSGKSVIELMARAGKAVAEEVTRVMRERGFKSVVFVCGPGNNGGDGYAAALLIPEAKVYSVVPPKTEAARYYWSKIPKEKFVDEISGFDCIVDCLLGIGIKGEPREPIKSVIERINESKAYKISVDVPSGLGTKCEVKSDLVIAIQYPKVGLEGKNFVVKKIW